MKINERFYPILATLAVLVLLYGYGIFEHRAFSDTYVLGALLTDNAFLIITAVGMTFVILSGGIDLSVGSMIAFVGVLMAELVVRVRNTAIERLGPYSTESEVYHPEDHCD